MPQKVEIFTDGASRGNPGPGGYGVLMRAGSHEKEISEGFRKTTNNRMELLAAIVALETLKKENLDITLYSDSKYLVDAVEKGWLFSWIKKGFKGKKNVDLWKRFYPVYMKHRPKLRWVKGHNDHPENERCDKLAVDAALNTAQLRVDQGFEQGDQKLM